MIAQVALRAGQRMASIILDITFLTLHRVVGVVHLMPLLLLLLLLITISMRLLLKMLLLLLLHLLMLQLLMQRRKALVMLVHRRVGKIVRR